MAVSASILAMVTAIGQAIVAVFSFLLAVYSNKNDKGKQKAEEIQNNEDKVGDICDNGTLSELIDATKDLGKSK